MADTVKNVTNLDIQLLDVNREGTTTIKLDNPKANVTREQVSAAMQTAFSEGWFISPKTGRTLMYLGNIIVNQSIKTILGGEDFYVTPSSLTFTTAGEGTFTVSGATIQGYNLTNFSSDDISPDSITVTIAENGLSGKVESSASGTFSLILIILGTTVTVPCTVTEP